MIPELGHFALILTLCVSLVQGLLPTLGAAYGRREWMVLARPAAQANFLLTLAAFVALAWSFYVNDFSVLYVSEHSNAQLPTMYRFGAVWGGHEGSLLLWVFMLSCWTVAVAQFSRTLDDAMVARVLGVLGLVASGLLLFILFTSNPFARLLPAAENGRDLNPMLQDPGLVFHPPMLYMGYVGFAVAFAFAIAALLSGRLDAAWARWSRPWTMAAWAFLTTGIALGSWWAYYTLGWGGWWFWDPVENASFMPWLAGTALIHSLAVTDKRDTLKSWTVLLAITTFSLSLLGTFLVRSGVLTSVHAFATDPKRGVFILTLLLVVIGGSLLLYAWRMQKVGLGGRFGTISRESFLLVNNLLMSVALAAVMLGTLYPLFLDVMNLGKISVGPPYFEAVMVPILLPAAWLMAAGPFARWKGVTLAEVFKPLKFAFLFAIAVSVLMSWWMGRWSVMVIVGVLTAAWLAFATIAHLLERLSKQPDRPLAARLKTNPPSYYGMLLAHMGVAVFIVGVTLVKGFGLEKDEVMKPGQTLSIGDWRVTFVGVDSARGPNYTAAMGVFELTQGEGKHITLLEPQKRNYISGGQTMTEAAIDSGLSRDVYISLGEPLSDSGADSPWSVRLYLKPFVNWIWIGAAMMALGGFLSAFDRRYRARKQVAPALAPLAPASMPLVEATAQ